MFELTATAPAATIRAEAPSSIEGIMATSPALPPLAAKKYVGARLKATRTALGINPVDVCKALGFAANKYSQWESGKSRPNLNDMILFCDWYGIPLDWIYMGIPSKLPHDLHSKIVALLLAPPFDYPFLRAANE